MMRNCAVCLVTVLFGALCDAQSIAVSPNVLTLTEGTTDTFDVRMGFAPIADVTISIVASDPMQGSVDRPEIIFTSGNWMVNVRVHATATADKMDDDDQTIQFITTVTSSGDPQYNGLVMDDIQLTALDIDTAGIVTRTDNNAMTKENGGVVNIFLQLLTKPMDDVTFTCTTSDATEAVCTTTTVTFTKFTDDYNVEQYFTITGVDDFLDDGDVAFQITIDSLTGYGSDVKQATTKTLDLNNEDNDVAGWVFDPALGTTLTTYENQILNGAEIRLKLQSEPFDTVTVTARCTDLSEGVMVTSQLVFHPSVWNAYQPIEFKGVDDNVDDGDVQYSIEFFSSVSTDAKYLQANFATYTITNVDDDTAEVSVDKKMILATEDRAGTLDFFVAIKLLTEPTADVTVIMTTQDESEVKLHLAGGGPARRVDLVIPVASYTQTFTVYTSSVDDFIQDGDTQTGITFQVLSVDPKYSKVLDDLTVYVLDNDLAGFTFCSTIVPLSSPCIMNTMLSVTEKTTTTDIYVKLNSEPTHDVFLELSSSDTSEIVVNKFGGLGTTLAFNSQTWDTFQTITVTGVQDILDDGDQVADVLIAISSGDPVYSPIVLGGISVTCVDTDIDECTTGVCNAAYVCNDPDFEDDSLLDFTCTCPPLSYGTTTTGTDTVCFKDECVEKAVECSQVLQACSDPDKSLFVTDDWVCQCILPAVGPDVVMGQTACINDECVAHKDVCTAFQQCVDPDHAQLSAGDWKCDCTTGVGSALNMAATCVYDECTLNTCGPYQECTDLDTYPASLADWICNCTAPHVGLGMASATVCTLNECDITANADICAAMNYQTCTDPTNDADAAQDWVCECVAPAIGLSVTAKVATCLYDECLVQANVDLCKDAVLTQYGGNALIRGHGIGHGYSQTCQDTNTSAQALGEIECVCDAPSLNWATNAPASCNINECELFLAASVPQITHAKHCENNAQLCVDPNTETNDLSSEDDWYCQCSYPSRGDIVPMTVTQCTLDECWYNEAVCTSVGQTCVDLHTSPTNTSNWGCNCTDPEVGFNLTLPAVCQLDECQFQRHICEAQNQMCVDANNASTSRDDWECRCVDAQNPQYTGSAVRAPAVCIIDECITVPCGPNQLCFDPDKNRTALGDFYCECDHPYLGDTNTGAGAICRKDECAIVAQNKTCTDVGQRCSDPSEVDNDWTCSCVHPYVGDPRVRLMALCVFDECTDDNINICAKNNQVCRDPLNTVSGTWQCECASPYQGAPTKLGLAECFLDECSIPENKRVCFDARQNCVDNSNSTERDWACVCLLPAVGTATASVASCIVDQCAQPQNVCGPNQACVQVGRQWKCVCRLPFEGENFGGPATCAVDGCADANKQFCESAGQQCSSTTTQADWSCVCVAPSFGAPRNLGLASCQIDECIGNTICAENSQICSDDKIVGNLNNWQCLCNAPAKGAATANLAVCTLDECLGNTVCFAAGQDCIDPTPTPASTGDWVCSCRAPLKATSVAQAVGDCTLNERECGIPEVLATCTSQGQLCVDANDTPDNWQCVCTGAVTGSQTMGAATCVNTSQLNSAGENVSDDDDDSGFPWLYVILPLALVLIIGALFACVYRTKRDKDQPQEDLSKSPATPTRSAYKTLGEEVVCKQSRLSHI